MKHYYYLEEVNSKYAAQCFEQIIAETLYTPEGAKERCKWFYPHKNTTQFLLYTTEFAGPIGTIGYQSRNFNTPLGRMTGTQGCDFSVLEDHRDIQSAFFAVEEGMRRMYERGTDFMFSTPNRKALGIFKRNPDFEHVGTFQRHIKLISFGELLQNTKLKFATPLVDTLWAGVTHARNLPNLFGSYDTALRFDNTDALWATYEPNTRTMGQRTKEYLTWRYTLAPGHKFKGFHFSHNGKDGYIVYMIIKNRAYVIDVIYADGDDDTATKMFALFERFCRTRKHSMIVVQYLGCEDLIRVLESKLWYRKYDPTSKELFVASPSNALKDYLVHTNKYWFAGDEDEL